MIVFIHIPKTGGTTVRHALQDSGVTYNAGHIVWGDVVFSPHDYLFTILRDPVERMASLYSYVREDVEHHDVYAAIKGVSPLDVTFREFVDGAVGLDSAVKNGMTRQFVGGALYYNSRIPVLEKHVELAKAHLRRVNHICFTRTLDHDLALVWNNFSLRYDPLPHENGATERYRPSAIEAAAVRQKQWADVALYQWAWEQPA